MINIGKKGTLKKTNIEKHTEKMTLRIIIVKKVIAEGAIRAKNQLKLLLFQIFRKKIDYFCNNSSYLRIKNPKKIHLLIQMVKQVLLLVIIWVRVAILLVIIVLVVVFWVNNSIWSQKKI